MKKFIAALLVAITAATILVGCGAKCQLCGDYGADTYEYAGVEVSVCSDCIQKGMGAF